MKQKLTSQPMRANKLALRVRIDANFSLTLNSISLGAG